MGKVSHESKKTILEVQVDAALQGHDLGPFEPVDPDIGGWQVACRKCEKTVWVGQYGVMYSLLGDRSLAGSPEGGNERLWRPGSWPVKNY